MKQALGDALFVVSTLLIAASANYLAFLGLVSDSQLAMVLGWGFYAVEAVALLVFLLMMKELDKGGR